MNIIELIAHYQTQQHLDSSDSEIERFLLLSQLINEAQDGA